MENYFNAVSLLEMNNPSMFEEGSRITHNAGLCNQMFVLTNKIIQTIANNVKILVVDKFHTDINNGLLVNASEIFNFEEISRKIKEVTQKECILIDRNKTDFKVIGAEYGLKGLKTVDVMDKLIIKDSYVINFVDFNSRFNCDPTPHLVKFLYLTLSFSGKEVTLEIPESNYQFSLNKHVIDRKFSNCIFSWNWYHYYGNEVFNKILSCIRFNSKFYEVLDCLHLEKTNIVHLRLEEDFILHNIQRRSIKNREEILSILKTKYLEVKEKIGNDEKYFILTSDETYIGELFPNADFIPKEVKEYHCFQKFGYFGREMCAVIDLLIGMNYSKNFVGVFDFLSPELYQGSSFSYTIGELSNVNRYYIDLEKETVFISGIE